MKLKSEQDQMQKEFRLHLNRIRDTYELTDKKLALLMGLKPSQEDLVQKMRTGGKIHSCRMITLCKNLIREEHEISLLEELVPEGYVITLHKITKHVSTIDESIKGIQKNVGKMIELTEGEYDARQMVELAKEIIEHATSIADSNE